MLDRENNNTGFSENADFAYFNAVNMKTLVPSQNSAFTPINKRKRSRFRDLVRISLKRHKLSEDSGPLCDDNTISDINVASSSQSVKTQDE